MMTPKQQDRIKDKIKKIKAALAADKRHWGGQYHDGQGLRYIPPQLYIKLNDFTGGLRYFNWFNKNFPDDIGYPAFLFEWTIVLFKTSRLKEAEKMAFRTFCSATYLFNIFLGKQVAIFDKMDDSCLVTGEFLNSQLSYNKKQSSLTDFSVWLEKFTATDKFVLLSRKYLDIQKQLSTERDIERRQYLFQQESQLVNEL